MGAEGAGVVVEVGPGVEGLAVGDAVLGLLGVVGSEAVVDARLVTAVPPGWSSVQAASVPVVFLTAWYGLSALADVLMRLWFVYHFEMVTFLSVKNSTVSTCGWRSP